MTRPTPASDARQMKREPAKARQPVATLVGAAPVMQQQTYPAAILQRATLASGSLTPHDMLRLQRTIGNRAVSRLIQTPPGAQRRAGAGFEAGAGIEQRLAANTGGGSPLPAEVRAYMEPRFGSDFSGVRLHTGGEAAQLNRAVSAQAFTHGQDIYLGEGKSNFQSSQGKQLLAHELTHVVQQTSNSVRSNRETPCSIFSAGPALQRRFDPVTDAVSDAKALGGGYSNVGVYMLWKGGDRTVVKYVASAATAVRAAFADQVLEAAGLPAPHSVGKAMAPDGQTVAARIQTVLDQYRAPDGPADKQDRVPALEEALAKTTGQGQGMIVMDAVGGEDFKTLLDAKPAAQAEPGKPVKMAEGKVSAGGQAYNLAEIANRPDFHRQLGKLLAADALLGNMDRLSLVKTGGGDQMGYMNAANFRVTADGVLMTIDSDAQIAGHALLEQFGSITRPEEWVDFLVAGGSQHFSTADGGVAPGADPEARPTQALESLFDPEKRRLIYDAVKDSVDREIGAAGFAFQVVDFDRFDAPFRTGIREALTGILTRMNTLKQQAAALAPGSGGLIDAAGLELKGTYAGLRMGKLDAAGGGQESGAALSLVQLPFRLQSLGEPLDPALGQYANFIPPALPKLSLGEKVDRWKARRNLPPVQQGTLEQAKQVKQAARAGTITPALLDQGLGLAGVDQRIQKGKFLAFCGKIELAMRIKSDLLTTLRKDYRTLVAELGSLPGGQALQSAKGPALDAVHLFSSRLQSFNTLTSEVDRHLTGKKDAKLKYRLTSLKNDLRTSLTGFDADLHQ